MTQAALCPVGDPNGVAVSVIVPCYNSGRFLAQLMSSLRAQTFQNFEVIMVDDGSTDAATLEALSSLGPEVKVLRQPNAGPAAARNAGIRYAQADLVLSLDCDDMLAPTFLAETVAAMQAGSAELGFVCTDMQLTGLRAEIAPRNFKLFDQLFINNVSCCLLYRKQAWEATGGYDESMRDGYEDWEFTIALARAGYHGAVINKPLFFYRVSSDGLMMTRSSPKHAELWAYIRSKHRDLYTARAVLRLWHRSRATKGKISLPVAIGLLLLARSVPNKMLSALMHRSRVWRLARGVRKVDVA